MSKKVLIGIACLALIAAPVVGHAAAIKAGEEYTLRQGQTLSDDLYVGARTVVSAGDVVGDLTAGGANVLATGSVGQDLTVAGGTVHVTGAVRDDAHIIGGSVFVEGSVADDLMVAGGQVSLVSGATVGGDLIGAAGMASIGGTVNGDVRLAAGRVTITGTVEGNVHLIADKVVIADTANIQGTLTYRSPNEAQIADGATVNGEVSYQHVTKKSRAPIPSPARGIGLGIFAGIISAIALGKLLSLCVLALLFVVAYGRIAERVVETGVKHFWKTVGLGFLGLVVTPIAAVVAFVTLLGIPLGIMLVLGYVVWLILAWIIGPIILGTFIFHWTRKRAALEVDWKTTLVGCVVMFILGFIPLVGWLIQAAFGLAAMGVLIKMKYAYFTAQR